MVDYNDVLRTDPESLLARSPIVPAAEDVLGLERWWDAIDRRPHYQVALQRLDPVARDLLVNGTWCLFQLEPDPWLTAETLDMQP